MTTVTVNVPAPVTTRRWRDIPHGQIFMGYSNVPFIERATQNSYGPWLKIQASKLYNFNDGEFWDLIPISPPLTNKIVEEFSFKDYRPFHRLVMFEPELCNAQEVRTHE